MGWSNGLFVPDQYIVCVDCGGRAGLLTRPSNLQDPPLSPGDFIAYRCADCNDRWDIEIHEPYEE